MVCLGIVASFHIIGPYTVTQYVVSGLVMFVSAEVLEGTFFKYHICFEKYLWPTFIDLKHFPVDA